MSLGAISLLFLLPALLFYAVFELWPIVQTIWYSLYDWNGIDESTFVGLGNYKTVFTDPDLYGSILHSFYLIIFFSIIPIMFGLIIAVLVKDMKSKMGRGFAQVCLFLPRVIPGAAAGVAWTWMLADKKAPSTNSSVQSGLAMLHMYGLATNPHRSTQSV